LTRRIFLLQPTTHAEFEGVNVGVAELGEITNNKFIPVPGLCDGYNSAGMGNISPNLLFQDIIEKILPRWTFGLYLQGRIVGIPLVVVTKIKKRHQHFSIAVSAFFFIVFIDRG